MTTTIKTIPIFVNSTFRDLAQERTLLAKRVFPWLNERCRASGIHLEQIDLNFGVSGSETSPEAMLDMFGSELNRASFIVCLLGDRFGWIPPREYDSITALGVYSALASRSSELVVLRRLPELTSSFASQFGGEAFCEPNPEFALEQKKLLRRLEWLSVPIHTYRSLEGAEDGFVETVTREIEKVITKTVLNKRGTVFISYSRKNLDATIHLQQMLESAGFTVWLDLKGIALGDNWVKTITKGIDDCDAVLLLVSNESVRSEYAIREIHYAVTEKKPILAYHLESVELPKDIKFLLGTVQHLEASAFRSFEAAFEAIVSGLNQHIPSNRQQLKPPASGV